MFRLKPAKDMKVRDPKTKAFMHEGGITIQEMTTYWRRRIDDKDVILLAEKKTTKKHPAKKKKKKESPKPPVKEEIEDIPTPETPVKEDEDGGVNDDLL